MKSDDSLISYISLWCGACDELSPYQFNLCFRSRKENVLHWFYFESKKDMQKAADYLRDNNCFVHCYNTRCPEDEVS